MVSEISPGINDDPRRVGDFFQVEEPASGYAANFDSVQKLDDFFQQEDFKEQTKLQTEANVTLQLDKNAAFAFYIENAKSEKPIFVMDGPAGWANQQLYDFYNQFKQDNPHLFPQETPAPPQKRNRLFEIFRRKPEITPVVQERKPFEMSVRAQRLQELRITIAESLMAVAEAKGVQLKLRGQDRSDVLATNAEINIIVEQLVQTTITNLQEFPGLRLNAAKNLSYLKLQLDAYVDAAATNPKEFNRLKNDRLYLPDISHGFTSTEIAVFDRTEGTILAALPDIKTTDPYANAMVAEFVANVFLEALFRIAYPPDNVDHFSSEYHKPFRGIDAAFKNINAEPEPRALTVRERVVEAVKTNLQQRLDELLPAPGGNNKDETGLAIVQPDQPEVLPPQPVKYQREARPAPTFLSERPEARMYSVYNYVLGAIISPETLRLMTPKTRENFANEDQRMGTLDSIREQNLRAGVDFVINTIATQLRSLRATPSPEQLMQNPNDLGLTLEGVIEVFDLMNQGQDPRTSDSRFACFEYMNDAFKTAYLHSPIHWRLNILRNFDFNQENPDNESESFRLFRRNILAQAIYLAEKGLARRIFDSGVKGVGAAARFTGGVVQGAVRRMVEPRDVEPKSGRRVYGTQSERGYQNQQAETNYRRQNIPRYELDEDDDDYLYDQSGSGRYVSARTVEPTRSLPARTYGRVPEDLTARHSYAFTDYSSDYDSDNHLVANNPTLKAAMNEYNKAVNGLPFENKLERKPRVHKTRDYVYQWYVDTKKYPVDWNARYYDDQFGAWHDIPDEEVASDRELRDTKPKDVIVSGWTGYYIQKPGKVRR